MYRRTREGIHPSRMPNLVELLRDYAVDTQETVASDNPLRQIIVNSHSPEVARQLSFSDIVFVEAGTHKHERPSSVFRPVMIPGVQTCRTEKRQRHFRSAGRLSPISSVDHPLATR